MKMDPEEMKRRSRGISSDMSPAAITRRLEIAAELYQVWRSFRTARRIGPVIEQVVRNKEVIEELPLEARDTNPDPYGDT